MAIIKVLSCGKSEASLKSCVNYVLNEAKTNGCVSFVGPIHGSDIDTKNVIDAFRYERENWSKEKGRTFIHSVLSFAANERVTPEQALEAASKLVTENHFYDKYQCLLAVHQDRGHMHCHIVQNPVSYATGEREHHNTADLRRLISDVNELCVSMGFKCLKQGYHADGTRIAEGDIISSDTKKYRVLMNPERHSYIAECMVAVEACRHVATNRGEFVNLMKAQGWDTTWSDERKYITFSDGTHRFRNSNLSKTFHTNLSKEALLNEFERTARGEQVETTEIEPDETYGRTTSTGGGIGNEIVHHGASITSNAVQRVATRTNSEQQRRKKSACL